MKPVYGPVPSWRLGRSLGIDPLCAEKKECPFDCIYCQLGRTAVKTIDRKRYIEAGELRKALLEILPIKADFITFSGSGEPTLASNLGELAETVRGASKLPLAILTSSALIHLEEVREDLLKFDNVVAKLDATDEKLFQEINRPHPSLTLEGIIEGLKIFRKEYPGKLSLQIMFIKQNKGRSAELADIAKELEVDEVQLDTPLRPSPVPPLSREEMEEIEESFRGMNYIQVYKVKRPKVKPVDEAEVRKRRPGEEY